MRFTLSNSAVIRIKSTARKEFELFLFSVFALNETHKRAPRP